MPQIGQDAIIIKLGLPRGRETGFSMGRGLFVTPFPLVIRWL
jgi:hypothetical protein